MNRTKVLLLALATLLASTTLQAQRIHAYVVAGMSLSQIEGDELKGFKQGGFNGGVGALASLDQRGSWYLSLEALFAQKGSFNNTGDPYSINLRMSYIDIPLLVHYRDPFGGMLLGVGLSYGRLVEQPHNVMKYNPNYFIPDTSDMTFLNGDLAIVADIRFTVWRGLMANLRWQHSLVAVKRDWGFSEYHGTRLDWHSNNCYNHSITLRLIWQF